MTDFLPFHRLQLLKSLTFHIYTWSMKKVPLSGGATPTDSYLSSQDRRWREVRLSFLNNNIGRKYWRNTEKLLKPEVLVRAQVLTKYWEASETRSSKALIVHSFTSFAYVNRLILSLHSLRISILRLTRKRPQVRLIDASCIRILCCANFKTIGTRWQKEHNVQMG